MYIPLYTIYVHVRRLDKPLVQHRMLWYSSATISIDMKKMLILLKPPSTSILGYAWNYRVYTRRFALTFLLNAVKLAPHPIQSVTSLLSIHVPMETCSCSSSSACCHRVTFCLGGRSWSDWLSLSLSLSLSLCSHLPLSTYSNSFLKAFLMSSFSAVRWSTCLFSSDWTLSDLFCSFSITACWLSRLVLLYKQ